MNSAWWYETLSTREPASTSAATHLPAAAHDHALSDVEDADDRYDVPEATGAGPLDVRVELCFQEARHLRPKEGGVQEDRVREFFLCGARRWVPKIDERWGEYS